LGFPSRWLLREIELVNLRVGDVKLRGQLASLRIRVNKTDTEAISATRTLQCCGRSACEAKCPMAALLRQLARHQDLKHDHERKRDMPLFFDPITLKTLTKAATVQSWRTLVRPGVNVTGHSARRTGALRLARDGWGIGQLMFLGRWRSLQVALGYVEEALADIPANFVSLTSEGPHGRPPSPQQRQTPKVEPKEEPQSPASPPSPPSPATPPSPPSPPSPGDLPDECDIWWVCAPGQPLAHIVDEAACTGLPQFWAAKCGWKFGEVTLNFMTNPRREDLGLRPCKKCERGRGTPVGGGRQPLD